MESLINTIAAAVSAPAVMITALVSLSEVRRNRSAQREGSPAKGDRRPRGRLIGFLVRPWARLVVAGVLAASVTILIWGVFDGDDGQRSSAERLLSRLVNERAEDCVESAPADGAIASIRCGYRGDLIDEVALSLFLTDEALSDSMGARVTELGVAGGSCARQDLVWERHSQGTLVCDYGDAGVPPRLEWTRHDSHVLVTAFAEPDARPASLYDWWRSDSTGSPHNNRLAYPDGYESYLLSRTGHEARQCHRIPQYSESEAAISCRSGDFPGDLNLSYYGTQEALNSTIYVRNLTPGFCVARTIRVLIPGAGFTKPRNVAETSIERYSVAGRHVGRRACYNDTSLRRPVVEWINRDSRIYGWAGADRHGQLERLFYWWKRTGRFLTD